MTDDWTFASAKRSETLWGPHGYHRYPAKFIPPLVRRLIETYSLPGDTVGDPFLGSATTGVEALRSGRYFYGSDISQVALFISRAKCTPLSPDLLQQSWSDLALHLQAIPSIGARTLTEEERAAIKAMNIGQMNLAERFYYWFPPPYRESLTNILEQIMLQENEAIRTFFLCGFSNILRQCSIWLSGSVKAQKDLNKVLKDPQEEFHTQIRMMLQSNRLYWNELSANGIDPQHIEQRYQLHREDARQLPLENANLDLLVTSPPYATCYEYYELHQLTQIWFERTAIFTPVTAGDCWIGSSYTSRRRLLEAPLHASLAEDILSTLALEENEQNKERVRRDIRALRSYFHDMTCVLEECARVVKPGGYIVFIIGDSYRRGLTIPTSEIFCEIARQCDLILERKITRQIPSRMLVSTRNKRSGRFSSVASSDTQVYPEEYILVWRR